MRCGISNASCFFYKTHLEIFPCEMQHILQGAPHNNLHFSHPFSITISARQKDHAIMLLFYELFPVESNQCLSLSLEHFSIIFRLPEYVQPITGKNWLVSLQNPYRKHFTWKLRFFQLALNRSTMNFDINKKWQGKCVCDVVWLEGAKFRHPIWQPRVMQFNQGKWEFNQSRPKSNQKNPCRLFYWESKKLWEKTQGKNIFWKLRANPQPDVLNIRINYLYQ